MVKWRPHRKALPFRAWLTKPRRRATRSRMAFFHSGVTAGLNSVPSPLCSSLLMKLSHSSTRQRSMLPAGGSRPTSPLSSARYCRMTASSVSTWSYSSSRHGT
ncbi:hypothetical protein D3C78_1608700 [compost metagenome]